MGRAERRKQERFDYKYEKEQLVSYNKYDIAAMKQRITEQATGFCTEALNACYALVLSRYGMDDSQLADVVRYVNAIMEEMMQGNKTIQDVYDELEEETGIVIKAR